MLSILLSAVSAVRAQNADLKIKDIPTGEDTTITIKKGSPAEDKKIQYEIISGSDEISSDEEFDKKKALAGWKEACAEWKQELKELNKDSIILSMSCGAKHKTTENNKTTYSSEATYRMRVKVKE